LSEQPQSSARQPGRTAPGRIDPLATLPVFFKLRGRKVLLLGASEGVRWKAELLAATGAHLLWLTGENPDPAVMEAAAALDARHDEGFGPVALSPRHWTPDDLADAALAIADLEDEGEIMLFAAAAKAAGVPLNVIDNPPFCEFQFGAIVNRSPLIISISTDGAAPVLGQAVRAKIEAILPPGLAAWARAARDWRPFVQAKKPGFALRRRFWERFTARALANPQTPPREAEREDMLAQLTAEANQPTAGLVSLVGAGPGDPELLTLKAVRVLQAADIVLYDDLVSPGVLELARREAERHAVGKKGYGPACKQSDINRLIVELALQGKRVVRLKGGDPLLFGRATEELDACRAAGVAYEIIPGISAAQGAAGSLGLSLTERVEARRVQFLTGHGEDGKIPKDINWPAIADSQVTTILYMGHKTLAEFATRAFAAGLPETTPACAIINATRPEQEEIRAPLNRLPRLIPDNPDGPVLIMIGAILRDR
jgi:uroporphyrin-III C-methyltransferase / precorrin-2 dehydrogenase / sirohydrochlorin ferrochelatase